MLELVNEVIYLGHVMPAAKAAIAVD